MAIVKRERHRTNGGQRAKIKNCKNANGRGSTGGKKTGEGRKKGKGRKNGEASISRRISEEKREIKKPKRTGGARRTGESVPAARDPRGGGKWESQR